MTKKQIKEYGLRAYCQSDIENVVELLNGLGEREVFSEEEREKFKDCASAIFQIGDKNRTDMTKLFKE